MLTLFKEIKHKSDNISGNKNLEMTWKIWKITKENLQNKKKKKQAQKINVWV